MRLNKILTKITHSIYKIYEITWVTIVMLLAIIFISVSFIITMTIIYPIGFIYGFVRGLK